MFCRGLPNRTQETSIQCKESCREMDYNTPFYYDDPQVSAKHALSRHREKHIAHNNAFHKEKYHTEGPPTNPC
ncbi:hypothetical protein PROFUN_14903 [Planoprotostelium fungivorum]|uniref:Uncharacterized protein n=1 Tax=Planoprotostelium fungivorum TaxID=1890364 RepID=A0A2P6MY75_9EUKA|nr:hypothetical protein PROFUN_14903 [Planoprotostelium fungivorum]